MTDGNQNQMHHQPRWTEVPLHMDQQVETEDVTWAVPPRSRSTEREDKLGAQTQVEE